MKFLLSLLVFFSCSLFANPHFDEARAQTYYVRVGDGHGTGVVINSRCIITASHVVADAKTPVVIIDPSGNALGATIKVSDAVDDLAVVCAETNLNTPPTHIARSLPPRYEPVFALGFPLQNAQVLTEGRYQYKGLVTVDIAPGNSGGGVFDADTGQLIGLSQAIDIYTTPGGDLGFPYLQTIIPSVDIISFLDAHKIEYTS